MIVSMNVSHFVKICQVLKILHHLIWVPGQEVDQRKLGDRLWKKTVEHVD